MSKRKKRHFSSRPGPGKAQATPVQQPVGTPPSSQALAIRARSTVPALTAPDWPLFAVLAVLFFVTRLANLVTLLS